MRHVLFELIEIARDRGGSVGKAQRTNAHGPSKAAAHVELRSRGLQRVLSRFITPLSGVAAASLPYVSRMFEPRCERRTFDNTRQINETRISSDFLVSGILNVRRCSKDSEDAPYASSIRRNLLDVIYNPLSPLVLFSSSNYAFELILDTRASCIGTPRSCRDTWI